MLHEFNNHTRPVNQPPHQPAIRAGLPTVKFPILTLIVFCMLAMPVSGQAKTALDEGLESAVYLQETVGDLDKAIEAYKKVIQESKKKRAVAAEAQYRIGKCYAQKGMAAKATAAFEAVVENYPIRKKWTKLAQAELGGALTLLPVPWGDGDELHLEMTLPNGLPAGSQVFRVEKAMHDGKSAWECSTWQTVTLNNQQNKSHVLADGESFAPINSHWRHTILGDAEVVFSDARATITMKGKKEPRVLDLAGNIFDNEQAAEVFRRLDLRPGLKVQMGVVSSLGMTQIPLEIEVTGTKKIKCPLGEFECFELKLNIGQTFYISNDVNRYLVRFVGGGVEANLTKVRTAADFGKPQSVETDQFTLTLPDRWHTFSQPNPKHGEESRTWLIAPDNNVKAWIEAGPLASVKKHHSFDSPKKWLESNLETAEKRYEDVVVDGAGLSSVQLGERAGMAASFEFKDGEQTMVVERKAAFGSDAAVSTGLIYSKDDGQDSKTSVGEILSSLKIK